jgi:transposase
MAERVRVRELTNEEGNQLLRIIRRGSGSVVRWRRAQIVLWSAQGMDVPQIAKIAFTSEDRVRAVIHNFNEDGFDSLAPKYSGGRPPTFTLPQRREIKKIALARPQDHHLPFSTWSLSKLAEFLVAEGVVDDISHEGLRVVLRDEGVSFQVIKTWKTSTDPDFEVKKNRVLELYDIADGKAKARKGDPTVVFCMDEFGALNLLPRPGRQWAPAAKKGETARARRRRATYKRTKGVRHLMAAYDLRADKLFGHVKTTKNRTECWFASKAKRAVLLILASQHCPNIRTEVSRSLSQRVVGPSSKTWPEQPSRNPVHHPATARKALTCAFNPKVPGSRPGRPTEYALVRSL